MQPTIDTLFYEMMHYFAVNVLLNKTINVNKQLQVKIIWFRSWNQKKELNGYFPQKELVY